ncbi:hypothetical protein D5086_000350 [Populus alba]|uniref:Uncharacterized protein n=1 Tax=Populus alba TaxID=43335 RepID=A0ACC4CX38_POPAL
MEIEEMETQGIYCPGGDFGRSNGTVGVCGFGGGFELGIGLSRSVILDMQPSLMHGLSSLLHGDSVSSWPFVESGLGGELKVS